MLFDIINWSPNYLSTIPYHLQLRQIILRAIDEGRFLDGTILPQPHLVGQTSMFQKTYALKAYQMLVDEGKLIYSSDIGYCLSNFVYQDSASLLHQNPVR